MALRFILQPTRKRGVIDSTAGHPKEMKTRRNVSVEPIIWTASPTDRAAALRHWKMQGPLDFMGVTEIRTFANILSSRPQLPPEISHSR